MWLSDTPLHGCGVLDLSVHVLVVHRGGGFPFGVVITALQHKVPCPGSHILTSLELTRGQLLDHTPVSTARLARPGPFPPHLRVPVPKPCPCPTGCASGAPGTLRNTVSWLALALPLMPLVTHAQGHFLRGLQAFCPASLWKWPLGTFACWSTYIFCLFGAIPSSALVLLLVLLLALH